MTIETDISKVKLFSNMDDCFNNNELEIFKVRALRKGFCCQTCNKEIMKGEEYFKWQGCAGGGSFFCSPECLKINILNQAISHNINDYIRLYGNLVRYRFENLGDKISKKSINEKIEFNSNLLIEIENIKKDLERERKKHLDKLRGDE